MPFVMTVRTTSASESFNFVLQSSGNTINCTINWGDGNSDPITTYDDPALNHTYAVAGDYDITITGPWTAPLLRFSGDKNKLIEIKEWGNEYGTYWYQSFYTCNGLISISAADVFGTNVTTMREMFFGCVALTTVNASLWDLSSLTGNGLEACFYNNPNLQTIDVSSWNFPNINSLKNTFGDCATLTALATSSWNVSGVVDFSYLFFRCSALASVDVSNWDVSAGQNFRYMFRDCLALTNLDVSNWDTPAATDFYHMFYGAAIPFLDVGNWTVSNVTNMSGAFYSIHFSNESYEILLDSWSKQTLQTGITLDVGTAKYRNIAARNILTETYSWTVNDGGLDGFNILGGFLWRLSDGKIYLGDGENKTSLAAAAGKRKIGIVYGSGTMKLNVDGVWSSEVSYNGQLLHGLLELFRGSIQVGKMREIKRWATKDETLIDGEMS